MAYLDYTDGDLLVRVLTSSDTTESKLALVSAFKSHVKRDLVDLRFVTRYFEALCAGVEADDASLATISFSALCHLVKRVSLQDATGLRAPAPRVLPVLTGRLGDTKQSVRATARRALQDYWLACSSEVEQQIRDFGFSSADPEVRLESVLWLSGAVDSVPNFAFRSFTPRVVFLLRDRDNRVSEAARTLLARFFSSARPAARNDLARELQRQKIPNSVTSELLTRIGTGNNVTSSGSGVISNSIVPQTAPQPPVKKTTSPDPFTAPRRSVDFVINRLPNYKLDNLAAEDVPHATVLVELPEVMEASFAGRETEGNWGTREKNIVRLRSLLRGNALQEYPSELVAALRAVADGVAKGILSLRTSLCCHGCQLVKECALLLGPRMDPLIDVFVPALLKVTAATKKISSGAAHVAICAVLANASYHSRTMAQLGAAAQDKSVAPRLYAASWFMIVTLTHQSHSATLALLESSGGLDLMLKYVERGLADANPGVREAAREAFWVLHDVWPRQCGDVMDKKIDAGTRKALLRTKPDDVMLPGALRAAGRPAEPLRSVRGASAGSVGSVLSAKRVTGRSVSGSVVPPPATPQFVTRRHVSGPGMPIPFLETPFKDKEGSAEPPALSGRRFVPSVAVPVVTVAQPLHSGSVPVVPEVSEPSEASEVAEEAKKAEKAEKAEKIGGEDVSAFPAPSAVSQVPSEVSAQPLQQPTLKTSEKTSEKPTGLPAKPPAEPPAEPQKYTLVELLQSEATDRCAEGFRCLTALMEGNKCSSELCSSSELPNPSELAECLLRVSESGNRQALNDFLHSAAPQPLLRALELQDLLLLLLLQQPPVHVLFVRMLGVVAEPTAYPTVGENHPTLTGPQIAFRTLLDAMRTICGAEAMPEAAEKSPALKVLQNCFRYIKNKTFKTCLKWIELICSQREPEFLVNELFELGVETGVLGIEFSQVCDDETVELLAGFLRRYRAADNVRFAASVRALGSGTAAEVDGLLGSGMAEEIQTVSDTIGDMKVEVDSKFVDKAEKEVGIVVETGVETENTAEKILETEESQEEEAKSDNKDEQMESEKITGFTQEVDTETMPESEPVSQKTTEIVHSESTDADSSVPTAGKISETSAAEAEAEIAASGVAEVPSDADADADAVMEETSDIPAILESAENAEAGCDEDGDVTMTEHGKPDLYAVGNSAEISGGDPDVPTVFVPPASITEQTQRTPVKSADSPAFVPSAAAQTAAKRSPAVSPTVSPTVSRRALSDISTNSLLHTPRDATKPTAVLGGLLGVSAGSRTVKGAKSAETPSSARITTRKSTLLRRAAITWYELELRRLDISEDPAGISAVASEETSETSAELWEKINTNTLSDNEFKQLFLSIAHLRAGQETTRAQMCVISGLSAFESLPGQRERRRSLLLLAELLKRQPGAFIGVESSVWKALVAVSGQIRSEPRNVWYMAVSELLQDFVTVLGSDKVLKVCLETYLAGETEAGEPNARMITEFELEAVLLCLDELEDDRGETLTVSTVSRLSQLVVANINSQKAVIRKLAVDIMVAVARAVKVNPMKFRRQEDLVNGVICELSLPQRRLIDHYSTRESV